MSPVSLSLLFFFFFFQCRLRRLAFPAQKLSFFLFLYSFVLSFFCKTDTNLIITNTTPPRERNPQSAKDSKQSMALNRGQPLGSHNGRCRSKIDFAEGESVPLIYIGNPFRLSHRSVDDRYTGGNGRSTATCYVNINPAVPGDAFTSLYCTTRGSREGIER